MKALALRVKLQREYTICNIYISPTEQATTAQFQHLLDQLPQPFILIGDMNARSQSWGDSVLNSQGRVIEEVLFRTDCSLLNGNEPTHFHSQTASLSNIDLAIASGDALNSFTWKPCDDTYGSDHFPILLSELHPSTPALPNPTTKYNFDKADWNHFYCATSIHPDQYNSITEPDELMKTFNSLIINAALNTIPTTIPTHKYPVPWWNEDCKKAYKERKKARRRYQRTKSVADKIALNKTSAIARRTMRLARKSSWQDFISSISSETPIDRIWKKINKISQKSRRFTTPCIKVGCTNVLD